VIVVDNASADRSAEAVAARFPEARLLRNAENRGFAAATNQGLAEARGRHLVLLNPDTEVRRGALARLVDFLDAHPRCGAVGPQLLNPDGSLQHGAFHFPTLAMAFLDFFPVHHRLLSSRLNGRYRQPAPAPFAIDHPLGACLMVRREVLEQVGTLDERFFMYCEEVDWCLRIKATGWSIYCEPRAAVVHHGGASAAQFRERMYVELFRSRGRLFAKHYSRAYRLAARWIVRAGLRRARREVARSLREGTLAPEGARARLEAYRQVRALV
jgi:GT2 family glycosyltransferase